MEEYVRRMIDEHKELSSKIRALKNFLDTKQDEDFNDEKLAMMYAQKCAMETYSYILAQRLCLEAEEGNCTLEDLNS